MGTKAVQRGATANTVSANVRRLRSKQNLGLRGLSKLLGEVGRPLTHSAVDQIEKGTRRVDVDDLMALAAVFDVPPITLLMPETSKRDELVKVTGIPRRVKAGAVWDWLRGLLDPDAENFGWRIEATPPWARKDSVLALYIPIEEDRHGDD
jgi:transcriptional regulator with XRE-family HTH domain